MLAFVDETLARTPRAYQTAMVSKELGIATLEPETVKIPEALTIGVSYLVGSFFPLIATSFFPSRRRCRSRWH